MENTIVHSKTICTPINQEWLHNLKISTPLSKYFPIRNKTEEEHYAHLAKQCPIQLMKNKCTSSKDQLSQERIFHHDIQQMENIMQASQNNLHSNWTRKIAQCKNVTCTKQEFSRTKKKDRAHHACVTKHRAIQLMKNNCTSSKFKLSLESKNFGSQH